MCYVTTVALQPNNANNPDEATKCYNKHNATVQQQLHVLTFHLSTALYQIFSPTVIKQSIKASTLCLSIKKSEFGWVIALLMTQWKFSASAAFSRSHSYPDNVLNLESFHLTKFFDYVSAACLTVLSRCRASPGEVDFRTHIQVQTTNININHNKNKSSSPSSSNEKQSNSVCVYQCKYKTLILKLIVCVHIQDLGLYFQTRQ